MEFKDVIKKRSSIRKFKPDPVPDDLIFEILKSIRLGPSAGNLQAYEIFIVKDAQIRRNLSRAALNQEFVCQAPVVLVFCTNSAQNEWKYKSRGRDLYSVQDATIACTYATLTATSIGLASVWVGAFIDEEVRRLLNLEPGLRPVALLPIGYGDENPVRRERRDINDFTTFL
jgi:nitroreductase